MEYEAKFNKKSGGRSVSTVNTSGTNLLGVGNLNAPGSNNFTTNYSSNIPPI